MKKALIFFLLTVACWVVAIVLVVRFVKTIGDEANASIAKLEAPGSAIFPIEEAGKVSLWHNYQDVFQGNTVRNEPPLPGGFSFELKEMGSGVVVPFSPSKAETNMSSGQLAKKGLGTFEISAPGDYELTVQAPPGERRVISLSKGTMVESFTKIFGVIGGAMGAGLAGLVFLIIGIVMLLAGRKPQPQASADAS